MDHRIRGFPAKCLRIYSWQGGPSGRSNLLGRTRTSSNPSQSTNAVLNRTCLDPETWSDARHANYCRHKTAKHVSKFALSGHIEAYFRSKERLMHFFRNISFVQAKLTFTTTCHPLKPDIMPLESKTVTFYLPEHDFSFVLPTLHTLLCEFGVLDAPKACQN